MRVKLVNENNELRKELNDLRQGICELSGCSVAGSRRWVNNYGDINEKKM